MNTFTNCSMRRHASLHSITNGLSKHESIIHSAIHTLLTIVSLPIRYEPTKFDFSLNLTTKCEFILQLILKTKTTTPLSIHFFALKGPFYDMKVNTQIYKHDFTDQENESEYFWLPLPDSSECNRLLASKAVNFRLIMFLLSK